MDREAVTMGRWATSQAYSKVLKMTERKRLSSKVHSPKTRNRKMKRSWALKSLWVIKISKALGSNMSRLSWIRRNALSRSEDAFLGVSLVDFFVAASKLRTESISNGKRWHPCRESIELRDCGSGLGSSITSFALNTVSHKWTTDRDKTTKMTTTVM